MMREIADSIRETGQIAKYIMKSFEDKQVKSHLETIALMDKELAIEYFRNNILNCMGEIRDTREKYGYRELYETQQWEQYHGIANRVWKVITRMS